MHQNCISEKTLFKLARRGKGVQFSSKNFRWAYLTNNGIIYRVEWEKNSNITITGCVDSPVPYIGY